MRAHKQHLEVSTRRGGRGGHGGRGGGHENDSCLHVMNYLLLLHLGPQQTGHELRRGRKRERMSE